MPAITPPAAQDMDAFLARHVPGNSPAIRRVRDQISEFAVSPTVRSLMIRGPIGAGKSTLARVVALTRRVAPLAAQDAKTILEATKITPGGQVDLLSITPFYTELSLTGLVESLAEAQLFGTVKGAYTGAVGSQGIFEKVSLGVGGRASDGTAVTGGVVFLDEIGDLPLSLQAKLLPVFSNGAFYRLGSEGTRGSGLSFNGVVITASWRDLEGLVRPDLLSRISGCVIDLPGIDDRKEDFLAIVGAIQEAAISQFRNEVRRLHVAEPKLARDYWDARLGTIAPLGSDAIAELAEIEWDKHGNFRGLRTMVEKIVIGGRSLKDAMRELPKMDHDTVEGAAEGLLARLLDRKPDGTSLGAHVKAIELAQRRLLHDVLQSDTGFLHRLAAALGIEPARLKAQLRQLGRERRGGGRGNQ